MKKLTFITIIAAAAMLISCGETIKEVEVIKIVTPTGTAMPDSLSLFFSKQENTDKYNFTLNELKRYDMYNNELADYIIVSYGRNKVATNCPDNNLMPVNCITFTAFRDNQIVDFYHYRISDWTRDYVNEDFGLLTSGVPIWNNTFFAKEYVYAIVPANGSAEPRKKLKIVYPF